MHPWEFDEYSFEEFIIRHMGYMAVEKVRNIEAWRQTRIIFFGIARMGGSKAKTPEHLMKLEGDREVKGSVGSMTKEEKREYVKKRRELLQAYLDTQKNKQ